MLSRPADTPDRAQTIQNTRKRPGYKRPPGFTGGNLGGVCVPGALWRPKAHASDPHPPHRMIQATNMKGTIHA